MKKYRRFMATRAKEAEILEATYGENAYYDNRAIDVYCKMDELALRLQKVKKIKKEEIAMLEMVKAMIDNLIEIAKEDKEII